MAARRLFFSRGIRVGGICATIVVLTISPASAAVTNNSTADKAALSGDSDPDAMTLTCTAGQVRYVQGPTDLLACGATKEIELVGEGGSDTIDLSALQPADFPLLTEVFINPGHFGDPDVVTGSFFGDTIEAEPGDEIHGLGGDDIIDGGGPIFAGDGNDRVMSAQGNTDLGPGDDRLVDPASGPWSGGPGQDTLAYDFSPTPPIVDIHFSVTDTVFHLDAPTVPPLVADFPSTQFESYDVTLLQGGLQTFSSAGFSGSVDVRGLDGVDKIVAGPGGGLPRRRWRQRRGHRRGRLRPRAGRRRGRPAVRPRRRRRRGRLRIRDRHRRGRRGRRAHRVRERAAPARPTAASAAPAAGSRGARHRCGQGPQDRRAR